MSTKPRQQSALSQESGGWRSTDRGAGKVWGQSRRWVMCDWTEASTPTRWTQWGKRGDIFRRQNEVKVRQENGQHERSLKGLMSTNRAGAYIMSILHEIDHEKRPIFTAPDWSDWNELTTPGRLQHGNKVHNTNFFNFCVNFLIQEFLFSTNNLWMRKCD